MVIKHKNHPETYAIITKIQNKVYIGEYFFAYYNLRSESNRRSNPLVHHNGTSQLYHRKLEKTIETEEIFINDIKVFSNTEFGELGVMLIDGKEYSTVTQCARILGYSNPQKAVRDHCKEDGCTKRSVINNLGRTQQMKYINEGNLYRLIVSSKLLAAEKFERWVFEKVLPSIRRSGGYGNINLEQVVAQTAYGIMRKYAREEDTDRIYEEFKKITGRYIDD